jgi:hypothetical protein
MQAPNVTAFSNGIRLSLREWLGVGLFTVLFAGFAPVLWKQAEPFTPGPDYRMVHALGNDYWLYERWAELAADRFETVLIGDSVVWGEYVTAPETLSHYLNELTGGERYGNLGLDGAHPLALAALVEHYAGRIADKEVVLQCNPLWLSSLRADLQDPPTQVNHPRLLPQFVSPIPGYQKATPGETLVERSVRSAWYWLNHRDEISPRLGVVAEQHVPPGSWTNHLQQAYYNETDLPSWTVEHPYDNPLKPLTCGLPPPDQSRRPLPQPWYQSGITKQDYPWVSPEMSLQWEGFRRTVEVLQRRANRVFVLVGPFNEHLLTPESRQRYQEVKAAIVGWLEEQQIPHAAPPPLASELYGDASHPLAAGYAELARQLLTERSFRRLDSGG